MAGIYNRTISILRVNLEAGQQNAAVGVQPYSGVVFTPIAGNTTTLFTGVPASIQAGVMGRKRDSTLPQDVSAAPTWFIYIPVYALAQYSVRDRDYVVDDEGYRYEVAQNWYDVLGYRLSCVREEA